MFTNHNSKLISLSFVVVGGILAFVFAPRMLYFWITLLPPIQKGYTLYILLMGSSRWIAFYSVLLASVLTKFVFEETSRFRSRLWRSIVLIGNSFILCNIGFLYLIITNIEIWISKDGWGAPPPSEWYSNPWESMLEIPLRIVLQPFFIGIDITDRVYVYFFPPSFQSFWAGLLEVLTIPFCLLFGLLLWRIVVWIFGITFRTIRKKGSETSTSSTLQRGWIGYMWLIVSLNWVVLHGMFIPPNTLSFLSLLGWVSLVTIGAMFLSWIFRGLSLFLKERCSGS